ncbi:MAG: hypothetical protein AB7O50_02975 [Pseudolabrys sp.]
MRTDTLDNRQMPANNAGADTDRVTTSLMTPARRAALDALEREFHELLNGPARKVA